MTRWGAFESPNADVDAYREADQRYDRTLTLARTFWDLDYAIPEVQGLVDDGRIPIVSFHAKHWRYPQMTVLDIANGVYDSILEGIGRSLGAMDALIYATFEHEPDGDWQPYPPEAWQLAYRRFFDLVKLDAPKVRIGPVFTGWFWRADYDKVRLGGRLNWIGVDPYCWPSNWQTPDEMLAGAIPPIVARWPRRPILVCETGCDEDARKPAWISALPAAVAKYPNIKGVSWFDVSKEHDWRLSSSAASLSAARAMLTDGVWA